MNREQLEMLLPEGIASFNEWETRIPKYQTPLMKRLDTLNLDAKPANWTRAALYEIILWEQNRFPEIDDALFASLATLATLKPGAHREGREIFQKLLKCRNIGLTMATAILRFVNPTTFQTLNVRNGRMVMGNRRYPMMSSPPSQRDLDGAAEFYFLYLDELRKLTGDGFDFRNADRLLYQLDKASGRKLKSPPEES